MIAGDGRRSVYDKKPRHYAETTEQNLYGVGKSGAEVTNNKRLCSRYCTTIATELTDTKHRAASLRQQSFLCNLTNSNSQHSGATRSVAIVKYTARRIRINERLKQLKLDYNFII